jgi:hypothetical protein
VEPALAMAQDRTAAARSSASSRARTPRRTTALRKFLSDQYGHVLRDFAKAIAGCMPGLTKEALYWRLDFLSGALTYAMADSA